MIIAKRTNTEIGEYLNGLPWKAFCTFTTEYQLSYYRAQKLADNLHKSLENLTNRGVTMFWVAEPHADFFRYHIHMLIESEIEFSTLATYIRKSWSKVSRFRGMQQQNRCDIREFDLTKQGGNYVTKYLDRHSVNWDLLLPTLPSNFTTEH